MSITPEQRAQFEKIGLDLVKADLATGARRYVGTNLDTVSADVSAAREWVKEVEDKVSSRESLRFWSMFVITAIGAIAAVIAAVFAIFEWIN